MNVKLDDGWLTLLLALRKDFLFIFSPECDVTDKIRRRADQVIRCSLFILWLNVTRCGWRKAENQKMWKSLRWISWQFRFSCCWLAMGRRGKSVQGCACVMFLKDTRGRIAGNFLEVKVHHDTCINSVGFSSNIYRIIVDDWPHYKTRYFLTLSLSTRMNHQTNWKKNISSDQNLATPYTNVAKSVEILNLSGNEINLIDDVCLSDYKDLIKLSLARNSIHTIELFAFESLEKLNYLDLSDNRLEVIDNRILERNEKLTFLDLSKNKFMLIDDSPLILSATLEFLSMRNSHLSHVYNSLFSELPNLIDLDISNNLLITLVPSSFELLESLQFINLEYNRFTCDFRIENTLQMFKQMKVHVKIDKCVKNSKKPMFEKMILHPDATTEMPEREDVEIDLLWGSSTGYKNSEFESDNETESGTMTIKSYYEKIKAESEGDNDEFNCDDDKLFPSTCECHQNFIKYYDTVERLKPVQRRSMEMRIATVFYLGMFLGVIAGSIVFFILSLIRKRCENANKKQVERQKARDRLLTSEWSNS